MGAPRRTTNSGIKVTTDLQFPVWDPKKNKARPKLWIEKFKRFVRFQNRGSEPEPYVEVQLLVHAVPDTSMPGRKIVSEWPTWTPNEAPHQKRSVSSSPESAPQPLEMSPSYLTSSHTTGLP